MEDAERHKQQEKERQEDSAEKGRQRARWEEYGQQYRKTASEQERDRPQDKERQREDAEREDQKRWQEYERRHKAATAGWQCDGGKQQQQQATEAERERDRLRRDAEQERQRKASEKQRQRQWKEEDGRRSHAASKPMSAGQAREILGIGAEATERQIRAAYMRPIKRVHPDAGGSKYFSQQLNAGRDVLIQQPRKSAKALIRTSVPRTTMIDVTTSGIATPRQVGSRARQGCSTLYTESVLQHVLTKRSARREGGFLGLRKSESVSGDPITWGSP